MGESRIEYIGKVALDYTYYPGEDQYCDGDVEDEILELVQNQPASEYERIIRAERKWPILYHLSPVRENIVDWIPLMGDEKVLEIGAGPGAITGALTRRAAHVDCVELSRKRSLINAYRHQDADNLTIKVGNFKDIEPFLDYDYDYIYLIGVLEYAGLYLDGENPYVREIQLLLSHLRPGTGRLVIAIENRLGLKYFAGAAEDHSGRYYDGIESYSEGDQPATTFTRPALERMLAEAGAETYSFYYPYPDYKFMDTIYSDRITPSSSDLSRNIRNFDRDRLLIFDERKAYKGICEDGLYPVFANSYEIIVGPPLEAAYCKYSNDRAPEYRIKTEIYTRRNAVHQRDEAVVIKYPLGDEAQAHVAQMERSCRLLKNRYESQALQSANTLDGRHEDSTIRRLQSILQIAPCWRTETGDGMTFPYIQGASLESILDEALAKDDKDTFLGLLTEYRRRVGMYESTPISDYDMNFQNIIVHGDIWTAIDYEWAVEQSIPVRSLLARSYVLYTREDPRRGEQVDALIGHDTMLAFLGVTEEELAAFETEENEFQNRVTDGNQGLGGLVSAMGTQVIKPAELQTEEERQAAIDAATPDPRESLTQIWVYYDTGDGYREDQAWLAGDLYEGEGIATFDIEVPENVRRLRIDPTVCPAIVALRRVEIGQMDYSDVFRKAMVTNGYDLRAGLRFTNDAVVFTTNDPNMAWDLDRIRKKNSLAGAMTLHVTLQMSGIPSTMADYIG